MKKTIINFCVLILFGLFCLSGFSQNSNEKITVSGTVIDFSGVPMPGVNIFEKGTSNGVVTDFDGKYSISLRTGNIIVFSYIGMKSQEIAAKNKVINVSLEEDTARLDEIVVVGYASQKRESVTSAVTTVSPEEIEDLPVGNLASALVGRVLGVSVSGGDTRPGNPARLTIRNPVGSLSKDGGTTDPLYVIDGVIQIDPSTGFNDSTLFNNLDASEVESISFLKDAGAAVYGSRAAQGVVLVVTKRGKKGPAKFSYSGNLSVADATYKPEMMSAYEFGRYFNIMNGPNGNDKSQTDRRYFFTENELEHFKTLDYDFLGDAWSSANTQRHNVNVSGGGDNGTYFAGISYYDQEGNLGTLDFNKWSFRAGSNVNLAKGLSSSFQVSGYFDEQSKTFNKINGEREEDDYNNLQNRAPFLPHYIDGNPVQLTDAASSRNLGYNYFELLRLNNTSLTKGNNITINANVEYEIPFVKGLKVKGTYARTESKSRALQIGHRYEIYEYNGVNNDDDYIFYESGSGPLGENTIQGNKPQTIKNGDRLGIVNSTTWREQTNFQVSYARDFGKHSLSGLFVIEKSESSYNKDQILKEDNVPEWATGQLWEVPNKDGANLTNTYNWASEAGDLGYIGRASYSYDEKYFADFVFRSDASAKFSPENYWGKFYAISGGWIVSKEDFWKSDKIDYLKIRGSVGLLGKDDVKAWSWLQRFSYQDSRGAVFGGNNGLSVSYKPGNAPNESVTWSDEFKTNIGIDARFLNNRLSTTIEQYYNIGTDILISLNQGVPFTVGGGSANVNYAEVDTWGTEISIAWSDLIGKDFKYGININTGWSNNKYIVGDFGDISTLKPWNEKPGGSSDIGTWGYDNEGMFKTYEEIDAYVAETGVTDIFGFTYDPDPTKSELKPGMLYYRDVRGAWDPETRTFAEPDGKITDDDKVQLRKPAKGPTGFTTNINLSYKNFSFNTVVSVGWGGYNMISGEARDYLDRDRIYQNWQNKPAFWADVYDPELNPSGTLPNPSKANKDINLVQSDFWAVPNFSLTMRNINLGYSLSKVAAEKLNLSSVKFNLVAINPFILNNPYKDWGLSPNGKYDVFPVLKTFSLGVNVGF